MKQATTPAPTTPKSKPRSERRQESAHPDGAAAIAAFGCPSCKARKGQLCIRHDGERTTYVHAVRFAKWEATQ